MARDFDRQVAEIRIRAATLNGYTALGIPQLVPKGKPLYSKGETQFKLFVQHRLFG